jgi:hypothetical protein
MTAAEFLQQVLLPGLARLESVIPAIPVSDSALVLMCATAGVETNWQNVQQTGGPARGYFQQQENDIADIVANVRTNAKSAIICADLVIEHTAPAIYAALLGNPKLQVGMTRLNFWADWRPLPAPGDQAGMWRAYLSAQRPGAPSLSRWNGVFPQVTAAMTAIKEGTPTV